MHHITCPYCEGKKTVPLSTILESTLTLITARGITASEVSDKLAISPSNANHRLWDLLQLKLVHRHDDGVAWRYFVTRKPKR